MPYVLRWRGAAVLAKTEAVAAAAVRETVQRTAARAASNHPWANRTGAEAASVRAEGPKIEAGYVKGYVYAASPAFFLEVGTIHMQAYPFMRPAAHAEFPRVVGLMRASLI